MLSNQNKSIPRRIQALRNKTVSAERFLSTEQAQIITSMYKENEEEPVIIKRAKALAQSLNEITISIDPEELIVGNRTPGIRSGVVFPEAGISWLIGELDTLGTRPQDPFHVRIVDAELIRNVIEPYWKGRTLEDEAGQGSGRLSPRTPEKQLNPDSTGRQNPP